MEGKKSFSLNFINLCDLLHKQALKTQLHELRGGLLLNSPDSKQNLWKRTRSKSRRTKIIFNNNFEDFFMDMESFVLLFEEGTNETNIRWLFTFL